jgi:hypothetical protein
LDLVVLPARQVGEEAVKGEHSQMLGIKLLKAKRGVVGGQRTEDYKQRDSSSTMAMIGSY